ncbi:hypothetical protein AALO_G00204900 [Alosa alosa]|uniref:Ig-like domain-containing protein n=1 Tax=Alosa alosa TaxID=278164 RepID=A0AAV6G3H9_9TELE|nr:hypothetical protein AALO_G00204900 [Alosa alosa]
MRQFCYYRLQSSVTFTHSIVDASDTGRYTCGLCSGFYRSRSISITVVVLEKPSLSLETNKEVSWGQSAEMRCSISTQHLGVTFTLQQLSGSFTETKRDTGASALFTIPQVDFIHEGDYYCQYQTRVSTREFTSPQSATVSLSVIVVLQKPSLFLETSKEVSWGQSAQMSCSISTQHLGGTFTLQQLSGSFTETKRDTGDNGTSALFTIPQVDFIHEGDYYCQYQTRVSSREFTSPQSATVSLSVIVVLVQPNISLSAPDGGLFWGPQGPEVTRGHSLSLICSTEPQHQGGSFHLIFDGSNRTRTQLAINHSASFYIPEAHYSDQGNYSCVYEVTVSNRTFVSTQTAPLTVTIRACPRTSHTLASLAQPPAILLPSEGAPHTCFTYLWGPSHWGQPILGVPHTEQTLGKLPMISRQAIPLLTPYVAKGESSDPTRS